MNNKEFISELSNRTGLNAKETTAYSAALVATLSRHLAEENTVAISGFGQFEVKRKMERIIVNPASKQRMLVPPKIVVGFKPVPTLKERINQKTAK
ncbi:MAG: HU family DNA-binding protein [Bacteroidaceae bacterium]